MATILIVDDNLDACRPLAKLLTHVGHKGICIGSGEQALTYLSTELPDMVLLDVMMPGMDGLEVLRRLRSDPRTLDLPVVMFSAISDPTFHEHALNKGATDFWVKASIDYETIHRRVNQLVGHDRVG